MKNLQSTVINRGFIKISKAAPLFMPFFLRGAAVGASNLGHRKMIEEYGRQLADKGIDPFDLPGKRQDSWIDPTMMYGMGLGLGAHVADSYGLFGKDLPEDLPLYLGTGIGGAIGAYQTYRNQIDLAKDILRNKRTPDTEYVKTRNYIKDKLEKNR